MDSRKSIKTYYGFVMVKKLNGTICGRFPLTKKECTFGRDDKCDIKILLENVSAHHCSIFYIDDKAYIRDKSLSGSTKVNGKKIGRNNFLLHHSDEIEICNRKFVWEYASSYAEINNLMTKKSGIRDDHTSLRLPEKSLNQINTPQDNKKLSFTPAKSVTKSSSKTLLSLNKTPIIVASANMSKHSFDELKNNLQKQNSSTKCQSEQQLSRSYSMVPGRNIPLIGDCKSAQRKSWVVTNSSDNLSSSGVHVLNKLSTERLKRDSTPEFNSSYHYQDENVEFDSPEPTSPSAISNDNCSVIQSYSSSAENNLSVDQSESIISQKDDDLQSFSTSSNILPVSESEPKTSRRDTYSIDAGSIVFEQNSTPTPRRSILKCSKTTKPNRSRSTCRMVQFARLPKTDSRIKMSKSRFNTVSNFVVTNDEIDVSQDSKSIQLDQEEYDDDLDGVQPLDTSVSSLINSPILDISSVHKSSKRGSRGNKVMSLISSFENRTNDSLKHSIRASDLLSMNGSISGNNTTLDDDCQSNSNVLQDSVSSRRINLEDVFVAEDSLKNESCTLENKTMEHAIDERSEQHTEITSDSEINLINNTNTKNVSYEVSKLSGDESNCEDNFNFASPLKIQLEIDSSKTSITDLNQSTLVDTEKDNNLTEVINNQPKTNISLPDLSHNIEKKPINEESPSMIIQCSSKMFNSSVDELEATHSQHKENLNESYVVVDKCNLQNSTSEETVASTENLTKSLMDAIEVQLDKIHDSNVGSNENELVSLNSSLDTNIEKTLTSSIVSERAEIEDPNLEVNDDSSKTSISKLLVNESTKNIIDPASKTKLSVRNDSSNIQSTDISQITDDGSDKDSTSSKNDKSTDLSETISSDNCYNIKNEKKKLINSHRESSNIYNRTRNSKNLNKSKQCLSPDVIESKKTRSSQNIVYEVSSNNDIGQIEESRKIDKSNKGTLDTSIGKPRYESTPWNGSKSSKTFNSTANNQTNETSHDDVSIIIDEQNNTTQSNSASLQLDEVTHENISGDVSVISSKQNKTTLSNSSKSRHLDELTHDNITENVSIISDEQNKTAQSNSSKSLHLDELTHDNITENVSIISNEQNKTTQSNPSKSLHLNELTHDNITENVTMISDDQNKTAQSNSSKSLHFDELSHDNITENVSIVSVEQNKTAQSNSSKSLRLDESSSDNITEKVSEQKEMIRSTTPDFKPEVWSQMMKDFNESVKKASCINYVYPLNNLITIPIAEELNPSKISIKVTTETGVSSNYNDSGNLTQEAEDIKTSQCSMISSCSSNNTLKTSIEHDQNRRSTRNSTRSKSQTEFPKRSLRDKSSRSKRTKMEVDSNSDKLINSVVLSNKNKHIDAETIPKTVKQYDTSVLNNLSSDISNVNSQEAEKPLPLFKPVTNCARKNKKTISTKPNISASISESMHDSDSSLNTSLRVTRNKKMTKKKHSSPELPPTRRNLRVKVEKNVSGISNKKLNKVDVLVTSATSSGNDTETGSPGSTNVLPTAERRLRKREQNMCSEKLKPMSKDKKKLISSNKPLKNTSNLEKCSNTITTTEKPKEIQPAKTRFTRNNSIANETSSSKLNIKTKSSSAIKSKSVVKVGKMKKDSNKKSQSKSLPSKPFVKKNKSDSSQNETFSETEEIPKKTQLVGNQPKTKKKNVLIGNNSSSPPTKRNRRELIEMMVSSQLNTRSRKRAADTSPLCQPNAKGLKRDISSKVASTINSPVSNSPKEFASANGVKLTRNMSKLAASQSSNSLSESAKNVKKEKSTTKPVPKKRVLTSEDSSMDRALSARKMTRKATVKENKTEIKKSNTSTRSKSKVQSIDTDESENSSKDVKKIVSPTPIRKRSNKQVVPKSTKSPPLRVLRSKRK